jgi:hypothetical protein
MHGNNACASTNSILLGDTWLSNEIPKLLNSQAYSNRGAIFITWDEGTKNVGGPFGTLVLSQFAKGGGYRMTNRLDHTATFRTLQEIFGVPFLYAAQNATSLSDLFKPTIQVSEPLLNTNGLFQFTANGLVPGKTNFFQFSSDVSMTNPTGWTSLLTNILATNRFTFTDTNSSNAPQRLYRVIEAY